MTATDLETAAAASATPVSMIGSFFMLDGATYATAAALGFAGMDFYFAGRGGVLGSVAPDVVAAALVFFNPDVVRTNWESSAAVKPRDEAARDWAGCCAAWADAHVPDDYDGARLTELAGRVVSSASPAAAPVFAGWRALPEPEDPRQLLIHRFNALRELRMARHGAAVVAHGVSVADAVRYKSPHMAGLFGWDGGVTDTAAVEAPWKAAEAATNKAVGQDLACLNAAERAAFVELSAELLAAVS
jgi:hypothetical protein